MSLVLAIEPDAAQAAQLTHIVKKLHAELIVVNTTGKALSALGGRAPDLVLVPPLLSPKEEATLAEALRSVAGDVPVRLLNKPLLSTAQAQADSGLMANLRKKKKKPSAVPDGCDPATFAEQISVYLAEAGAPAPPPPESVAPSEALTKSASHAGKPAWFGKASPVADSSPLVKAGPAKEPMPSAKAAPSKGSVPPAMPAPRAEPWPLAASSLVAEPARPEPSLSASAEAPAWSSIESLLINATEHPPVQEPAASPEPAPLADPLFSTAAEPPVWSSIESLFINAAENPPNHEAQFSPEPPAAEPLFSSASEPPFSTAPEPPVWDSIESLFINAAEHPPAPEPLSPEPTPSWMSHVPDPAASFDIAAAVAPKEVIAAAVPKDVVAAAAPAYPDEPAWRDLAASFRRAVDALEIEKWLAVGADRAPEAPALTQPAESPQLARPDEEPCDEWGFYDPARYGLSAVLNKIDRLDGPNKHAR